MILVFRNVIFSILLIAISVYDVKKRIVPIFLLIASTALWIGSAYWIVDGIWDVGLHFIASVVYTVAVLCFSLVMDKAIGRESIGGGDIKLIGVIALYLGLLQTLFALIIACIVGIVCALIVLSRNKKRIDDISEKTAHKIGKSSIKNIAIAFAPALSFAAIIMLFFGESIENIYYYFLNVI